MRNMKKVLAAALTATMVMGSTFTTFAADANSGSVTGTGTSEGHVDKKVTNVVLPVETTDYTASTFAYIMDPERLISGTTAKKYADGATFPAADADTGVYFLTGTTTYGNTSNKLKVQNKSTHDISLTVTAAAKADTAATDIPLVAKDALTSADAASLYLGLAVGSDPGQAITKDTAATKTVTIAGTPGNFKTDVKADKSGYEYREKTESENGGSALAWQDKTFNLEGAVTTGKDIASTTTAPAVDVTWKWVDPTAATAPDITTKAYNYDRTADLSIPVSLGTGSLAATDVSTVSWSATQNGEYKNFDKGSKWDYSAGTLTFKSGIWATKAVGDKMYLKVTLNDTNSTAVILELTISK